MNEKFYEIICRDDTNSPVQILLHGEIGLQNFEKGKIHSNEFIEEIMSIPRERKIQIRMNSIGGSFLDGLAIGKAIRERGNVECHVDGCCASAATIPAFCCSRVTASDGAFFLLHESRGSVENKTAENLRNLANQLDDKNRIMAEVYATKSGRPIESFFEIMREEKTLTAQDALQLGLVDEIIPVTAQPTNNITVNAKMTTDEEKVQKIQSDFHANDASKDALQKIFSDIKSVKPDSTGNLLNIELTDGSSLAIGLAVLQDYLIKKGVIPQQGESFKDYIQRAEKA